MAELILGSLVDSITGKAVSLVSQEIGLAWVVKGELKELKRTVSSINALFLEAEKREVVAEDVKEWLRQLKDVVYDADDLLDDFSTELLRRGRVMGRAKKIVNEVRIFFSSYNQLLYAFKMAHRVKDIRDRLVAIRNDKSDFKAGENSGLGYLLENRVRPETFPAEPGKYMVGRDNDKERVMAFVLNPDFEKNVSILPIVGFGGLGKTTLAGLVFNDERVVKCFDKKLWLSISTNFDVKAIVRKILEKSTSRPGKFGNLDIDELKNKLKDELVGKRFLLVLDDVWNEDPGKWDELEKFILHGAKGSKILVTTRSPLVAATMAKTYYKLSGLSEDESLSLLMQMAMKEECDWRGKKLESIAKEIVKKCYGVPLAIVTIGRLLRILGDTEKDWLKFTVNEWSRIEQKEDDILPSLKLSYDFLPSHLKQCFAYCSLFPKDCVLDPSELIHLWMAQGFIKSPPHSKSLEDIGLDYFKELASRSFFQEIEEDQDDSIMSCKMHDMMHDLAQFVAGNSCFIVDNENVKKFHEGVLHASIWRVEHLEGLKMNRRVRSLLLILDAREKVETHLLDFSLIRNLRTLRLRGANTDVIPGSIGKLKHLRSLDLYFNVHLRSLPNSISELCNLETLNLKKCFYLERLPRGITKLVNLRHLDATGCERLTHIPRGIGNLTNLQMLSTFVIGESGNLNAAGLNELSMLTGLQKKLRICNLGRLRSNQSAVAASFSMEKLALQSLELEWVGYGDAASNEEVLEKLLPHPNLKKLSIISYLGASLPSWISQMHKLVELKMNDFLHCKYLPPLDQLPSLKRIDLDFMYELEYIELSESGASKQPFFPSLQEVRLNYLPIFKGWRRRMANVNRSEEVEVEAEDTSLLIFNPTFSDTVKVKIYDCYRFSYMHRQELELNGISNKDVHQLVKNSTQSPPIPTRTTSFAFSLSAVKSLTINLIQDAEHFPLELFQSLTCLQNLKISNCYRLKSLPWRLILRDITTLESLEIGHCNELDLSITGDDDDERIQNLQLPSGNKQKNLKFLSIERMNALPWWLRYLTGLEHLELEYCRNLKGLPEWLPELTSLRRLRIIQCGDELFRRCERNTGEDWSKISHIASVGIRRY